MPRAETGDGVSAVRSKKVISTAAAWEGNALRRALGFGDVRSMTSDMLSVRVLGVRLWRKGNGGGPLVFYPVDIF